jgi:UDP-N-acetylmuramate--alanine ligase
MTYQPHRYTRTRDLFADFVEILSEVDRLLLLNVYSAGETPIPGADSADLLKSIRLNNQSSPIHIEDKENLTQTLNEVIQDGDVLLLQGAGDIGSIAQKLALSIDNEQTFHI